MSRMELVREPEDTKARELLEATQKQLGRVPNLYRVLANAPAALDGYLALRESLLHGVLDESMRERLALLVAEENGCHYCVSAHLLRGEKLAGLSRAELALNRQARSQDGRVEAGLRFARRLLQTRGQVTDAELAAVREAGFGDAALGEMVGHLALNTLSNLFNHLARPPLDFPAAPPLGEGALPLHYGPFNEPEGHRALSLAGSFEQVAERAAAALVDHGFLLLHTIDTRTIMARGGHAIAPLRQLLFFHPDLMRRLLELDPGAITAAPLKLVLLQEPEGAVRLLVPRPESLFAGHPTLRPLADELRPRLERLSAALAALG